MCSETSPRISFSSDLGPEDGTPAGHDESRRDISLLDSSSDFEFIVCSGLQQESCSADELFANGMIRPVQVLQKRSLVSPKQAPKSGLPSLVSVPPLPSPYSTENSAKEREKAMAIIPSDTEEKPQAKSFWSFKRSSSLNCDIKKSLTCSFPLLSRSNSTGSVPIPKRAMLKDAHKQKQATISMAKSSSSSSSSRYNMYQLPQKPPLKKNIHGGSYNNGVRISPVLNVPPPYISKGTAKLFGFGSFLRNGKDKKKLKKSLTDVKAHGDIRPGIQPHENYVPVRQKSVGVLICHHIYMPTNHEDQVRISHQGFNMSRS